MSNLFRRYMNIRKEISSHEDYKDNSFEDHGDSGDGLYTIKYAKKDVNQVKDSKSLETLSKLDSSIERFVRLLHTSIEEKNKNSAKSSLSKSESQLEEGKPDSNEGQTNLRNFDEYCRVSEGGFYECLHCPEVSLSIEEFKKHYKERHLKIYYDCQKCGFSTRCYGTMTDHILKYHDNDTSIVNRKIFRVKGSQDDTPVRVPPILTNNQRQQGRTLQRLSKGNLIQTPSGILQNHKELIIDSDAEKMDYDDSDDSVCEVNAMGSKHECKVCLQEFTRSERVREHYDAIHRNMVYVCSICGYTNRWKRSVIQHLRSKHEKSPPYKPLMIKKRADSESSKSNPGISSSSSSHQSPADLTSTGSIEGEDEMKEMKMEEDGDGDGDDIGEELEADFDEDFGFDDMDDNDDGIGLGEAEDDEDIDSPEASIRYQDDSMAYRLNQESSFANGFQASSHLRLVWACRKCGFSHKWRTILNNHLRINHKLRPPFSQYLVRKKAENTSLLDSTLKSKLSHFDSDNSDPYLTENSETASFALQERTRNLDNLNSILKMPSTSQSPPVDAQPFPCRICNKSFDTLRGLKDHSEGMHSDMVWACKKCSFTDKWRPQAVSHLRNKHGCKPPYNDYLTRRYVQSPNSSNRSQPSEDSGSHFDLPSTSSNNDRSPMDDSNDMPLDLAKRDRQTTPDKKLGPKDCYSKLSSGHFQCNLCSKICSNLQGVTEHYEAFHLNMIYFCQLCNHSDIWYSAVIKHLKRKHHVGKPYDMNIRRVEIDPSIRNQYLECGLPHPEPFLQKSLISLEKNFENASLHRPTHRSPPNVVKGQPKIEVDNNMGKQYIHVNNQLKCKICWSLFTSLQGFQEHYEAIHLDIIWTCRQCSHSFRWRQQLTKHLKLVHKCEPPFNEHMIKETGSHKLKKPIPEKSPHAAYSRRTSSGKLELGKNSETEIEITKPAFSIKPEPLTEPSSEQSQNGSGETIVPDKSLSLKNYLFLNNQFSCKICAAVFSSLQGFQEHYEAIHLNIVYACKLCGFENRWRPQVTTHLKKSHSCEPPFNELMVKTRSYKTRPSIADKSPHGFLSNPLSETQPAKNGESDSDATKPPNSPEMISNVNLSDHSSSDPIQSPAQSDCA